MAEKPDKPEGKSEAKKPGTGTEGPKSRLGLAGAVLFVIGLAWFVWDTCLRPENAEERKKREEDEQQKRLDAKRKR